MDPDTQNQPQEPQENNGMPQAPGTADGGQPATPPSMPPANGDMPEAPEAPAGDAPETPAPAGEEADEKKW